MTKMKTMMILSVEIAGKPALKSTKSSPIAGPKSKKTAKSNDDEDDENEDNEDEDDDDDDDDDEDEGDEDGEMEQEGPMDEDPSFDTNEIERSSGDSTTFGVAPLIQESFQPNENAQGFDDWMTDILKRLIRLALTLEVNHDSVALASNYHDQESMP
ncbi:MAG: hypothetical protein M1822_004968 [Bathelium mastoideum]|nr:MAG: hypothetical protein M1822_004968 [Bathelium mastoideum]